MLKYLFNIMIKEERLNNRKIAKRLAFNCERLLCSKKTMRDIFEISFYHKDFTFFNFCKSGVVKDITYGEVRNQVERFANHFQKTIGEDCKYVGLLLENCPEWVSSFYGLFQKMIRRSEALSACVK